MRTHTPLSLFEGTRREGRQFSNGVIIQILWSVGSIVDILLYMFTRSLSPPPSLPLSGFYFLTFFYLPWLFLSGPLPHETPKPSECGYFMALPLTQCCLMFDDTDRNTHTQRHMQAYTHPHKQTCSRVHAHTHTHSKIYRSPRRTQTNAQTEENTVLSVCFL